MPSYHSIRIFEILYDRSHQLQNSDIGIDLEELKNCLKLKDKYKNFADFKRRVLDQAKKDLEKGTPIKFTYSPVKEGNKVVALDFVITKNLDIESSQLELDLNTPRTLSFLKIDDPEESKVSKSPSDHKGESISKSTLLERLVDDFGIKMRQATQFIEEYDESYIKDNLEVVEKRYQEGGVDNLSAYTFKALTNDYRKQAALKNKQVGQEKISPKYKILIGELSKMGYLGNGLSLIKSIGEQGVKDIIKLAKEQEKASGGMDKEIGNMGGLINWFIKEEAWKTIALQRKVEKEEEAKRSQKTKEVEVKLGPLYDVLRKGIVAKFGEATYGAWYKNIEIISTDDAIEIYFPTKFIANWIREHHKDNLEEIFAGKPIDIEFNTRLVVRM